MRQRPGSTIFQPPLTLAETASTFAEMVLTRALLAREPRPEVRVALAEQALAAGDHENARRVATPVPSTAAFLM